jgi:hypothetical protein
MGEGDNTGIGLQNDRVYCECLVQSKCFLFILHPSAECQRREARPCNSPSKRVYYLGSFLLSFLTSNPEPIIESFPSHGDNRSAWKNLVQQQQLEQRTRLRHFTTDTEEGDDNSMELADQADPESGLSNIPQTAAASSRNDKGRQKALLKHDLSPEAKQDIHAFSTQVLEMAKDLADHLGISRKDVLISAGLGMNKSRRENITHLHAQWYATTHTKPDGSTYLYGCSCLSF